jgi:competence protein CoiA
MQLAFVNDKRVEASLGARGVCPLCGSEMIAKCGPRVMHHWAHHRPKDCDPWWENETQWHRDWKNLFPLENREVSHIAKDGEIHRADVKTPSGIVVELQHSTMTDTERQSRETFYGNMVWVLDGSVFRANFDIYHGLPDPKSEISQDLVWFKAKRHMHGVNGGMFYRLSENPGSSKGAPDPRMVEIHSIGDIQSEVDLTYRGHHQYDWVRPRKTWLDAKCPVYIDFGDDKLVMLDTYDESGLGCIRFVAKRKFVHDTMVESKATDIASRFYPLPEDVQ